MDAVERILVYLGPSLPLGKAKQILPHAVYRPPAKQGDIVTDVINLSPTRIILIDGVFRENLSVWHKEIVYALQHPGVKAIYGAASMGALRAAELDFIGMIGIGQIYEWYRDGITEDDSEVALSYSEREGTAGPLYYPSTVPLVDIRAAVEYNRQLDPPDSDLARESMLFLEEMREIHYTERTPAICTRIWGNRCGVGFPCVQQKAVDATQALADFASHKSAATMVPTPDNLSVHFQALYERDRRAIIKDTPIPLQHIDSYVTLHNPEYERICWDAANQELALLVCDCFCVIVSMEDIERESVRFQQRIGAQSLPEFEQFLELNGWSKPEYHKLMIQNARIRKLQHCLTVTKMYRRNTASILDYLRTHQGFDFWAAQAADLERAIAGKGVDDWLSINLEKPTHQALAEHMEKEGMDLKCTHEEYLLETGFSNQQELSVALSRLAAGKD